MIHEFKEVVKALKYKGHVIMKIIDCFDCEYVFIDNNKGWFDDSPLNMSEDDFWYASIADAKRFINGQQMTWIPGIVECLGERYYNRFKHTNTKSEEISVDGVFRNDWLNRDKIIGDEYFSVDI